MGFFVFLDRLSLRHGTPALQWLVLVSASLLCMAGFYALHLPAAFLLGAMLTAIAVAMLDGSPRLPKCVTTGAQGVVGCLVASSFTPAILQVLRQDWPLFLVVTLVSVLLCALTGWALARRRVLPGSTAIWGSSPGGAMLMTLLADQHGGDMRMVAVMQYSRVVIVTAFATLCAHIWADVGTHAAPLWFPPVHVGALGASLAVALGGSFVAERLHLPGGPLVLAMLVASALQMNGVMQIELPLWLLAPTYAVLGWMIGLRFTRQAVQDTAKQLVPIILSILALIALCAMVGWVLSCVMRIDPLTAFLATSPGGVDAVAIIASSSGADVAFVMAFQVARLFAVMFIGPALAQFATRRLLAES